MEEKIKSLLKELFPEESDRKYYLLTEGVTSQYDGYKSVYGYNANENLLKCIFIGVVDIHEAEFVDEYMDRDIITVNKRLGILNYSFSVLGYTLSKLYNGISSSRTIGGNGSDGQYYVKFSSAKDKLFVTHYGFTDVSIWPFGLSGIIQQNGPIISSLYELMKDFHGDTIALNKCSEKEYSIFTDSQIYNLCYGLSLEHAEYMPDLSFSLEPNYFNDFISNETSDYYKYDDCVAQINSSLISYANILFIKQEYEELLSLCELIKSVKGRSTKHMLSYLNGIIKAKEIFDSFSIN